MKEFLTIITPTYNRKKEIKKLYESLLRQKNKSFVWLIIDDGSNDGTDIEIEKYIQFQNEFRIYYIKKENKGKHDALNLAFDNIKTEIFMVVDSDDFLTDDAVETIYDYFMKYKEKNIKGFVFLKGYTLDKPIVTFKEEKIGNYISDVINKQKAGDRVEIFFSDLIKEHRFPVYKNEKFIGEGFFWCMISKDCKMLFVNKIIYICNYLDGGLTKSGRKLRIDNSVGGMRHAKEYLNKEFSTKIRIKNMILFLTYERFAKQQGKVPIKIKNSFLKYACILPYYILYKYCSKKYD